MVYQPETPFPKSRGDAIRSTDWNAAITEMIRLDQAKLNQTGGTVTGNLTVQGNLSATGTISGTLAANSVPVDRLRGSYSLINTELLIRSGVFVLYVSGGPATHPLQVAPLISFTVITPDPNSVFSTITYTIGFEYSYKPDTGLNTGSHFIRFENSGPPAVLRLCCFFLRLA